MTNVKLLFVFVVCLVVAIEAAVSYAGPVSLETYEVVRLRELVNTNAAAAEQFSNIRKMADKALNEMPSPIEVVVSEGHLQKDPLKIRSTAAMADKYKIMSLAWAWAVTDEARYLSKARDYLLAWAKVNKTEGNAINETQFEMVIVAYDLVRSNFSKADRKTVDAWLQGKADALWAKYKNGGKGNWVSHGLKITGLIALTLDDEPLTKEVIKVFRSQIGADLRPDGSCTDFYVRDAMSYQTYSIEPLLVLARAGERHGEHLFDYRGTNGASLHTAVDFVVPFAEGSKTHMEFVNSKSSFDSQRANNGEKQYQPHVWDPKVSIEMFGKAAWFRPEYGELAAKLAGHPDERFINWDMVINAVSENGMNTKMDHSIP